MKLIIPVPITDTTFVDSSAAAVIAGSVTEFSTPSWVSRARYEVNQTALYSGVVYQCIQAHNRRTRTPDADPLFWAATTLPATRPGWTSGGSYSLGDRIARDTTHRIYECIKAHSTRTTLPERDPEHWLDIGPTNRWAMFDQAVGSRTAGSSPLTFTLQPGLVNSLAILNLDGAQTVEVTMKDGTTVVYNRTLDMSDTAIVIDWYDYFFVEITPRQDVVLSDLPLFGQATIEVEVLGASTVGVGTVIVGNLSDIAPGLAGAQVGIIDYSRKEADEFGVTNVVERGFAKRLDINMLIPNQRLDAVAQKLSAVRATPCVWFDESGFQSLIVYGFARDWQINVSYPANSDVSLSLEGLT